MKPIRLTFHALEQCQLRGATEDEVRVAIESGTREVANKSRIRCRFNFPFDNKWREEFYRVKQVSPIIKEEETEIVVVTVFTYYF